MPVKISVRSDLDKVTAKLASDLKRQIPYATARALTRTAQAAQAALKQEIAGTFDRPTPWVRNSPFMAPATKAQLTAAVGIRDASAGRSPAHFLRDHVTGGSRGNKPLELAMQRMGVLPPGWLVVPSNNGVKLDAFGNVPKATVARILQALATGTTARRGADTFRVFAVRPGEQNPRTRHLAPGVWSVSRVAGETVIQLVFLFVRAAQYDKVFDVAAITSRTVRREFPGQFVQAFDEAMKSAR